METQKIVNLLNASDNENSKFATKKWYAIDNESNWMLESSCQGVKRFFVLAYNNKAGDNKVSINSFKKYFPRVKIENCNIEIDGRNLYDQAINDSIKQYNEIRKIPTKQGDDYTTGCVLDFAYFDQKITDLLQLI